MPPSEQEYFCRLQPEWAQDQKAPVYTRRTLVAGANIAGFKRVAEAMMEQGVF